MLKLILEILKLFAVATGTVSGLIGTLTETKNKQTGKMTAWGRKIVALLIASGLLGITIQSVEAFLKHKSETDAAKVQQEEAKARALAESRTQEILEKAETLRKGLNSQANSLSDTVRGVERVAHSLGSVYNVQKQTMENVYGLTHPLGNLRVTLSFVYSVGDYTSDLNGKWITRLRSQLGDKGDRRFDVSSSLGPNPHEEAEEYEFLAKRDFQIAINKTPIEPSQEEFDRIKEISSDRGGDLLFRVDARTGTEIFVNFPTSRMIQTIYATMSRIADSQEIRTRADLYGAEVVVSLPEYDGNGSVGELQECTLQFVEPGIESAPGISLLIDERGYRRHGYGSADYVSILSEKELGPKPMIVRDLPSMESTKPSHKKRP